MKYFITSIFFLYSLVAQAATIHGHVTDMDNQQAIANATLIISQNNNPQQFVAITDSHGVYTLSTPPQMLEGEFLLKITHHDYYTVHGVVLVKDQATRNFSMKIAKKVIEEIQEEVIIAEEEVEVEKENTVDLAPTSNLVFLIDVSASMNFNDRIGMLKTSLQHLASLLRPTDKVSIVTYSTEAKVHMKTTTGDNITQIQEAIEELSCGGVTMGGRGLDLAYKVAKSKYIKEENNRIILVTDGIFTSTKTRTNNSMDKLIRKMKNENIYLSVFSFGDIRPRIMDNLKTLANLGGGNYAHIDSEEKGFKEMAKEAKRIGMLKK